MMGRASATTSAWRAVLRRSASRPSSPRNAAATRIPPLTGRSPRGSRAACERAVGGVHGQQAGQRRRVLLGAAALVVLVVLIAVLYLRPNPFSGDYQMRAVFPDAIGIANVGRDVRIAGVKVGTIAGVSRSATTR